MLVELIAAATFSLLIWWGFTENPAPLFGVYSQPGKFFVLKRFLFWILLKLRQRKRILHDENAEGSGKVGGYGRKSRSSIANMESVQKLDPHRDAIDTMYFTSVAKDGSYCVLRIARRHDRKAEVWLSIKLPDIGVLQSPVHPDTTIYNTDGKNFSAGGLTFECIEPMRRWKISFNGLLRKGLWNDHAEKNKGETVHVKFSFVWEAFSDFFDFDTDIDPGVLADAVAQEPWTREFWNNLRGKHQSHYEQWGEMLGSMYVEGYEERKLYFKCLHDHSYGVRDWRDFYRYMVHFFYLEDGTAFQITSVSLPTTLSHLKTGYVALPCGVVVPMTFSSLEMPQMGEDGTPRRQYSFIFKAGGRSYKVEINMVDPHEIPHYYHHDDWRSIVHECFSTINVNGVKGWGIAEHCYRYSGGSPVPIQHSVTLLREYDIDSLPESDRRSFVLPFTSLQCTSSKLVGGKGCQLALLTQLNSKEFTVPVGMCLTIASFEHQMSQSEELTQAMERLAAISSGRVADDLKVSCEKTVQLFQNAQMNEEIQVVLRNHMEKTFGTEGCDDKLFAVRSSAAGEDSAEMSAAGQMETILGVKGIQQVFTDCYKLEKSAELPAAFASGYEACSGGHCVITPKRSINVSDIGETKERS